MVSTIQFDYLSFVAAALSALTEKNIVTKIEYDRISKEVKSGKNVEYVCAGEVNVVEEIKQTYAKTAELVAQRYIPPSEHAELSQAIQPKADDTPSSWFGLSYLKYKYKQTKTIEIDTKNKVSTDISLHNSSKITKESILEKMGAISNFQLFGKSKSDNKTQNNTVCYCMPMIPISEPLTTRSTHRRRSQYKANPQPIIEDDPANSDQEIRGRLSRASWKNIQLTNSVQKLRSYEDIHQDLSDITLMPNTKPKKYRQHRKLIEDKDSDQYDSDSSFVIIESITEKEGLMKGKKVNRARHISERKATLFDQYSSEEFIDTLYHDALGPEFISDKIVTGRKELTIDLLINLPSGNTIIVEMESKYCLVNNIKYKIKEKTGIAITEQVLHFGGYFLRDEKALHEYSIKANSTIHLSIKAKGGAKKHLFYMNSTYLDPPWDYDFTDIRDGSTKFMRGGHQYYRPCGWKRIAIKVIGKYSDEKWLGHTGAEGEWAVTYHGTKQPVFEKICEKGYKVGPGAAFGKGVYSSPDINVAKVYATKFPFNGVEYLGIFQNRVNPKGVNIVNDKKYWVCSNPNNIRPYGLCVKKC